MPRLDSCILPPALFEMYIGNNEFGSLKTGSSFCVAKMMGQIPLEVTGSCTIFVIMHL